jgi:hypothetical protein
MTDLVLREPDPRRVEATAADVVAPLFLYANGRQIGLVTEMGAGRATFIPNEPHRVEATPADVATGAECDLHARTAEWVQAVADLMAEELLLYGYVGGRADHERQQEEARRHRSQRVIDRAIDEVRGAAHG